ncbi:MAG TPA: hypothetical protein VKG92_03250, partial [Flavobacteriales bacterium]|nr:hypothetical protein [Flavobacteriales bacterium]
VCEVMQVQGRFVLLNASEFGCPPGSVAANDHLCIGIGTVSNLLYYEAVDLCANRGGNLCTWDEYYTACVVAQSQLTSLFNNWEWLDDTSNHTHTANQAGRLTCKSQRSESLLDERKGEARCCFHLR